jgi:hypothetical protein
MERFTKYKSPLTTKLTTRQSSRGVPPAPESVLKEDVKQRLREFDETKSSHDIEKKASLKRRKQLKQESDSTRERLREKVHTGHEGRAVVEVAAT